MRAQIILALFLAVHGAAAVWNEPTSWFAAAPAAAPAAQPPPDPIMAALNPPPAVAADHMSGTHLFVSSLAALVIGGVVVIKLYETLKPVIMSVLGTWFGMFAWMLVGGQVMLILRHVGVPTSFGELVALVLRQVRP